jgi:hypothetical protein
MNRTLFAAILLAVNAGCSSQPSPPRGEFATNLNGLMYSDNDIKALRFVVDSLNLRFKTCDLNKTYYSNPQARIFSVSFKSEKDDLKEIIKEMETNEEFSLVIKKYKPLISSFDTSLLTIRGNTNKNDEPYYYMKGKPIRGYSEFYINKAHNNKPDFSNHWIYYYSPKSEDDKSYDLVCHYFPEKLKQQPIPDQYARLIQYVDCMIDTAAYLFLTDKYQGGWFREDKKESWFNLKNLADYLDTKMSVQKSPNSKLRKLSEVQESYAINHLREDATFRLLLAQTIDEYVKHSTANYQLENLAEKFNLYDKALLMKRCYKVMGSCSQDESPRLHARDIAILAAQSHSWDIFLRAHLDIMNDRFERASDGSYAWGGRKTYLKELEELNLNIVDLMIGLTLRADNTAGNHYYGTIWRMGWALTESKEKNIFEEKAIAMMTDNSLDEFNRGLVFLLYKTYISYLDEKESVQKIKSLKENIVSFPGFIQTSIQAIDESAKSKRR